ncbi:galactomannan galactosyltransferase 1-like [Apium graveolens]|uniref:galactomannan galactosyltransferase 1-like n=1 Tax=Apium graveolens TaxID=4045 RepID=UPI003D78FB32
MTSARKTSISPFQKKLQAFLAAIIGAVLVAGWVYTTAPALFHFSATLVDHQIKHVSHKLDFYIPGHTFYDDPDFSYSITDPVKDWDQKRGGWLKQNPVFASRGVNKVLLVTGSQPWRCESSLGDYLLLRLFKNKVDYCRIQGYEIFYNNAFLETRMNDHWAKPAAIRASMMAHPEMEWIWWVDSDAVITDMEFRLPLEKYKDYNLVVNGWPNKIFNERSWLGLNSGVVLFRNCQWTMDFLSAWASMGPISPDYEKWGKIFKATFQDRNEARSSDQTAMVYLVLKHNDTWGDKIYYEDDYCLQCYWARSMQKFKKATQLYVDMEKNVTELRRRHAEVATQNYGGLRNKYLEEGGYGKLTGRRPFITHFVGCSPCSGTNNQKYSGQDCTQGLEMAMNFGDNQVLRTFGFVRHQLENTTRWVVPLPFDAPGEMDIEFPN